MDFQLSKTAPGVETSAVFGKILEEDTKLLELAHLH